MKYKIIDNFLNNDDFNQLCSLKLEKISSEKIISGECGVPGVIALKGILSDEKLKSSLKLNSNSNVLLIGCEGLTDEVNYEKLLSKGIEQINK